MRAVTLITDFGLQDGHVGAMKGAIRSIAPDAELVDISHEIRAQDIRHAGFVLKTAYPYWPADTIHVIVVDPGVGTGRRAVAVQTGAGSFVAPDNGVLSFVLAQEEVQTAVALTNAAYWRHPVSASFHGRDIFGPAAAHLANGVPILELGESVNLSSLIAWSLPGPHKHLDGHMTAHVLHVDRFGNCTTDLPGEWLHAAAGWRIEVPGAPGIPDGGSTIDGIAYTFGDVPERSLLALVDSTGYLAIAVRNGNAAQALKLKNGAPIEIWPIDTE
jgi:S-adenosylmethionine hydrolase